jgi:predicted transcriptional regulator
VTIDEEISIGQTALAVIMEITSIVQAHKVGAVSTDDAMAQLAALNGKVLETKAIVEAAIRAKFSSITVEEKKP